MADRYTLLSRMQDAYHYLLAATGDVDPDGCESTFDHSRLVERVEFYERGRDAFIDCSDIADDLEEALDADLRGAVLDSAVARDFRDEGEMKVSAKLLLDVLRNWCVAIEVDAYSCTDLRTGKQH